MSGTANYSSRTRDRPITGYANPARNRNTADLRPLTNSSANARGLGLPSQLLLGLITLLVIVTIILAALTLSRTTDFTTLADTGAELTSNGWFATFSFLFPNPPLCPTLPRPGLAFQANNLRRYQVNSTDGTRINVIEAGLTDPAAPTIMFVHGFAQAWMFWLPQLVGLRATSLIQNYRLIAWDWRGTGNSDHPTDLVAYTAAERYAEDMEAVITQRNVGDYVVVGHSMGPPLIIGNHVKFNGIGDIKGFLFDCPSYSSDVPYATDAIFDIVARLLANPLTGLPQMDVTIDAVEEFVRLLVAPFCQPDLPTDRTLVAVNQLSSFVGGSIEPPLEITNLPRLGFFKAVPILEGDVTWPTTAAIPMLLIHGVEDAIISVNAADAYATARPANLVVEKWPRNGHSPNLESPRQFNKRLCEFAHDVLSPPFLKENC